MHASYIQQPPAKWAFRSQIWMNFPNNFVGDFLDFPKKKSNRRAPSFSVCEWSTIWPWWNSVAIVILCTLQVANVRLVWMPSRHIVGHFQMQVLNAVILLLNFSFGCIFWCSLHWKMGFSLWDSAEHPSAVVIPVCFKWPLLAQREDKHRLQRQHWGKPEAYSTQIGIISTAERRS